MSSWFWYGVAAAVLYGAHQIFTRLASERISDGLGGFVVEASAALSILLYLAGLWFGGRWNQKFSMAGFNYSVLTGICVGAGTIAFFLLFQKGGPLSAVPMVLAAGAALMAIAGIVFFKEPAAWPRLLGIVLALAAGVWSALHLPIDAVPDITGVQVQINTEVPALAAEESEKLVTRPIEIEMAGLPGIEEMRSLTKFGLSQVTLQFDDRTDIYRARQLVTERLQAAMEHLPHDVAPKLAPISTGLGEIFYYNVSYKPGAKRP